MCIYARVYLCMHIVCKFRHIYKPHTHTHTHTHTDTQICVWVSVCLSVCCMLMYTCIYTQHTDTDKQTNRQTDRQTDRQTQTYTYIHKCVYVCLSNLRTGWFRPNTFFEIKSPCRNQIGWKVNLSRVNRLDGRHDSHPNDNQPNGTQHQRVRRNSTKPNVSHFYCSDDCR